MAMRDGYSATLAHWRPHESNFTNLSGEAWSDLLRQPGSLHCIPCTTHRPLLDWDTFRDDDRALRIGTDIFLAPPFSTPRFGPKGLTSPNPSLTLSPCR
jgi:hypothetical protein